MNKHSHFTTLTMFLLISFFTTNCLSQRASFQSLGDFPGGSFESAAQCVSNDGSVVAGSGTTDSGQQAFRWTQSTGMKILGNLPDSSLKISWVNDISADGRVIVGGGDTGSVRSYAEGDRGFRWNAESGMIAVGGLNGSTRSEAWSVSSDGSVIVGDGGVEAFRWTQSGGIVGLGVLPNWLESRAMAVSDNGLVVTGSCWSARNGVEEAFRWTEESGMQAMGYLSSGTWGTFSFPNAISPDGSVIAGTSSVGSTATPFRWTQSSGMVSIGHLPGMNRTHPSSVSAYGKIIVGTSSTSSDDQIAFIWDSTTGIQNLKTVLQNNYGLNLTGWTLRNALGITPDGNVIVGWGTNPSGNSEAFRIVLDTLSTGVKEKRDGAVRDFQLHQNYPNPFNPSTVISYRLSASSKINLTIYNVLGQKIKTLINSFQCAGEHSVVWNATGEKNISVSSGIYFYKMETNGSSIQKKMILVR